MIIESKKNTTLNLLKELVQIVACDHDDTIIEVIDAITLTEDYDHAIERLNEAIKNMTE